MNTLQHSLGSFTNLPYYLTDHLPLVLPFSVMMKHSVSDLLQTSRGSGQSHFYSAYFAFMGQGYLRCEFVAETNDSSLYCPSTHSIVLGRGCYFLLKSYPSSSRIGAHGFDLCC